MSDAGLPSDVDNRVMPSPYGGAERGDVENPEDWSEIFTKLRDWWRIDRDHSSEWRAEARKNYDFAVGVQWTEEDKAALRDQNRPVITFDRIGPVINIVCGLETGNRQEVRYIPREIGDGAVNDLLTEAARWVRDECDAEDEESDAFRDLVTCGMGWSDTALRYDEVSDGKLYIERLDPLEMYWDAGANKKNLADARRMFRVKDVPLGEAREMFPDATIDELDAQWAADTAGGLPPHDATEAPYYRYDQSWRVDRERKMVRMVEAQWWEFRTTWRVWDPAQASEIQLDDGAMSLLRERSEALGWPEPIAVKQRSRHYRRAMIGSKVLDCWDGPAEGGFTWKVMTGARDRNRGIWFGLVRSMIDPQQWANKWMSQTLHILNTGAKGGIMAEQDAFDDIREAEENWADPQAIVEVAPGALQQGKIQPRPQNPMPQGLPDLLTLAISSIRDCTGVNMELLGLVEQNQPGILEHMRKQAGMTVLAGLFDALRRYRKDQGRLMLWYIVNFLSDGRLVRIGGASQMKYVPLVHQPGLSEYDVIVDDTPNSPNLKEQAWGVLMQLMPYLSRLPVPPPVYMELLKYSPLPETIVSKIEAIISNQPQKPDPMEEIAKSQAQYQAARTQLTQAQTQKTMMEAGMAGQGDRMGQVKSALEAEEVRAKIENLRAQALATLAKAGATQQGAQTDQLLAVLDVLDGVVNFHQNQNAPTTQTVQ